MEEKAKIKRKKFLIIKKKFLICLLFIVAIAMVGIIYSIVLKKDSSKNSNTKINQETQSEPQIEVEVDLVVEENEQKSVDEGHSPWKLDPAFVAQVFASLLLSPDGIVGDYPIAYEDVKLVKNDGNAAIAEIDNKNSIAKYVYMKRLIRQDDTGIWTVVGYDSVQK